MKKYLILAILLMTSCSSIERQSAKWSFQKDCSAPESVYYDRESGFIFVSNMVGGGVAKDGHGHISKLSSNGEVLNSKWIKGLNAPKGMRSFKGKLWVSDIDRVIVIDIKTGELERNIKINGAKFLNDVAISDKGIVYISDSLNSKIFKISNFKVSTFVEGNQLESPNGLLIKNDNLYVASWGLTTDWTTEKLGRLYSINIKSKEVKYITSKPLGNLDGLEISNDGDFLVSDWVQGKIYKISSDGSDISVLYKGKKGLADIGYIAKSNTILIPSMLENLSFGI